MPNAALVANDGEDDFAEAFARIECHYFVNHGWFEGDTRAARRTSTESATCPAVIVQGRYDVVCPMESAWALHKAWPRLELKIVPDAGHSAHELGTVHELVSATDRFSAR